MLYRFELVDNHFYVFPLTNIWFFCKCLFTIFQNYFTYLAKFWFTWIYQTTWCCWSEILFMIFHCYKCIVFSNSLDMIVQVDVLCNLLCFQVNCFFQLRWCFLVSFHWIVIEETSNHATSTGHCIKMYCISINKCRQNLFQNCWRRYNNYTKSFRHKRYSEEATLSKYIWEIKKEYNEMPTLKCSIVKPVPSYSNILEKCLLCLHERPETVNFEDQDHLLNKRFELICKCWHANKYLLRI